jgi:hypothetical protein
MSSIEQQVTEGCLKPLTLLATFGILVLAGCQEKARSDGELAAMFYSNEKWFEVIASTYTAGKVICSDTKYPDDCVLSDGEPAVRRLIEDGRVQVVYVKRNRGGDDGVWIPVQTYGVMSMSSFTRGYVYLDKPPSSFVKDTLSVYGNGSYFKPLKGKWYLFISN